MDVLDAACGLCAPSFSHALWLRLNPIYKSVILHSSTVIFFFPMCNSSNDQYSTAIYKSPQLWCTVVSSHCLKDQTIGGGCIAGIFFIACAIASVRMLMRVRRINAREGSGSGSRQGRTHAIISVLFASFCGVIYTIFLTLHKLVPSDQIISNVVDQTVAQPYRGPYFACQTFSLCLCAHPCPHPHALCSRWQ